MVSLTFVSSPYNPIILPPLELHAQVLQITQDYPSQIQPNSACTYNKASYNISLSLKELEILDNDTLPMMQKACSILPQSLNLHFPPSVLFPMKASLVQYATNPFCILQCSLLHSQMYPFILKLPVSTVQIQVVLLKH